MTAQEIGDFIQRLREARESSDPDKWVDLYVDDFVGVQPLMPTLRGRRDGRRRARLLFRALPDLTCEIRRWTAADDVLYVEYTVTTTYGGKPFGWAALDRYRLRGSLAVERVSYYDGLRVLMKVLRRPRGWPQILRARLRPAIGDPVTGLVDSSP